MVPITPIIFDQLVSGGEQRQWYCKAECLRGIDVDDKLEFGWLLDREIGGRLSAFENAIGVDRRFPELINKIYPIGNEAAQASVKKGTV